MRPYNDFDPDTWPPRTSWPEGNAPVFERDGSRCVVPVYLGDWRQAGVLPDQIWWKQCPHQAETVHHRVHGNHADRRPAGLLSVHGSGTTGHHGWIESHPTYAMERGWTVTRYDTDPAAVPVWLWHPIYGLGWYRLDNEYGLTPTEAPHAR